MTTHDPLPAHLDRIGQQLTAAARQRAASQRDGRRRRARALGALPVAAVVAAVVLLLASASTTTTPAYALTRHADGSITITLSQLTTGIPALNTKLHELGINETVIPITAGCHSPDGSGPIVMHPNPLFEYKGSISATYTPRYDQRHPAPPGFHYVLAAKRLPNGKLLGFIGSLKAPVPTCLPYNSTPSLQPQGIGVPGQG
jgi:hypothetical protein